MENINEFLISQDVHLGNNWVCADLKGNVRTIDLPKLLTAFADEQTKPLKEEIERLKSDNQSAWNELHNILDDPTRELGTKIAYLKTKFNLTKK